jgi:hypothetical protein
MMRERGLHISIPETIPKPEANCQIEDHIDGGASFTASRNDRRPKLDVLASSLVEAEAEVPSGVWLELKVA